jgi:hypothetical protein
VGRLPVLDVVTYEKYGAFGSSHYSVRGLTFHLLDWEVEALAGYVLDYDDRTDRIKFVRKA